MPGVTMVPPTSDLIGQVLDQPIPEKYLSSCLTSSDLGKQIAFSYSDVFIHPLMGTVSQKMLA